MSTEEVFVVDTEGAVRTWLRSGVAPLLGDRVFFGFPTSGVVAGSAIATVSRVGGRPDAYLPTDTARISVSVWATSKRDAMLAAAQVANAFANLGHTDLDPAVHALGATVEAVLWSPDPPTGLARYVVDALVTTRAR